MKAMTYLAGSLVALATITGAQSSMASAAIPVAAESTTGTASQIFAAFSSWYTAWSNVFTTQFGSGWRYYGYSVEDLSDLTDLADFKGKALGSFNALFATTGYGYTQSFDYTKNTVSASTATYNMPVPGPIAAAGLPAVFGLVGFAAWKRRRAAA